MIQTITFLVGLALGGIIGFLVGAVLMHDTIDKYKK